MEARQDNQTRVVSPGRNSAGFPQICATFQRDNLRNVTGITDFGVELAAKRLGLCMSYCQALVNRGVSPSIELLISEVQAAATVIGRQYATKLRVIPGPSDN